MAGGSGALDNLVRRNGIAPEANGFWRAEVVADDRTRTDMEYSWGDPPLTRVVVEAKIGHSLTAEQIAHYRSRFKAGGLLVVLVPAARKLEAVRVVGEARKLSAQRAVQDIRDASLADSVPLDVWTYDDVTAALESHMPASSDVAQFKGLVYALRALDIFPMTQAELTDNNPTRRDDIWRVVDSASFGLFGKRMPSGKDWGLEQRRYVVLDPYPIGVVAGVGRTKPSDDGQSQTWAWLRVNESSSFTSPVQSVLKMLRPAEFTHEKDGFWVPLHVPTEATGTEMINAVRDQIETIGSAIREEIDRVVEAELEPVATELRRSVTAVMGILPIPAADLVDGSAARKVDIELILKEAVRSLSDKRINPQITGSDYEANRYVQVTPFDTHVCIAIGRKIPPIGDEQQPWAWIRVDQASPHAEIAYSALERIAPDRLVIDPHGRAIPLDIPANESGSRMMMAARDQIHAAIAGIREAIRDGSNRDSSPTTST